MGFEQQQVGSVRVVRPIGRLDNANAPEFERGLKTLLDAGTRRLLLDLGDLDYISSAGLRVLLMAGRGLRASQGRLVLTGSRGMVQDVFEVSGILSLFEVTPDAATGIALLET